MNRDFADVVNGVLSTVTTVGLAPLMYSPSRLPTRVVADNSTPPKDAATNGVDDSAILVPDDQNILSRGNYAIPPIE